MLVYVSAGICTEPRDAESLCKRTISSTMEEEGEITLTTEPVLEVKNTEVMGTLKLRKDAPAGGASVTVTAKLAVPGGGGTFPPTGPLQELNEKTATASKVINPREFRFM